MSNKNGFHAPVTNNTILTDITPDEIAAVWAERAHILAEPPPIETTGHTLDLLVFTLNDERFGIEINYVREVHADLQITAVPRTPSFVIGIFSGRGQLASVVDLSPFLGLPPATYNDNSQTILVHDPETGMELSILADNVLDVITIFKDELEPALNARSNAHAKYTQGIAKGMTIVLDLPQLLNDPALLVNEDL
ncbi:MAG TPA: chemotaxis protein CheW [Anaerolineae bacterium]|nr:chemotaxis protein CheW [Anaerolineae bacterium]